MGAVSLAFLFRRAGFSLQGGWPGRQAEARPTKAPGGSGQGAYPLTIFGGVPAWKRVVTSQTSVRPCGSWAARRRRSGASRRARGGRSRRRARRLRRSPARRAGAAPWQLPERGQPSGSCSSAALKIISTSADCPGDARTEIQGTPSRWTPSGRPRTRTGAASVRRGRAFPGGRTGA